MLRKLFRCLALFTAFTLAYFVLRLFYHKDGPAALLAKPLAYRNSTFGWMVKERAQQLWEMMTEDGGRRQEWGQIGEAAATNWTLVACPDIPPDLLGPLRVEFNYKRTMDEVREEVSGPLRDGGRYKPPDCIAQQKVAIIIPFRNRHEHLKHWLYYLHPMLIRQQLDYRVYVINQDGEGVFNRAKLLNVGYVEALKDYDYDCFVFSDVDLVPIDDRNLYRCFDNPRHLAVAMDKFNFHLPYNNYFGGVCSLSKEQYMKINGFPNTYWGWGGEDDDIYNRVVFHGMSISRPDLVIGKYKMIKHVRDLHNEPNPRNPDKLSKTRHTMDKDGLNSLKYTVKGVVQDRLYTFITVDIEAPLR